MEEQYIAPVIILGSLFGLWIFYLIIVGAVRAGAREQNEYLKIQNRLLVKMLRKQGLSKQELLDIYNLDTDKFWESIEQ